MPVKNAGTDMSVVLTPQFSSLLIQGDETWRVRRRNIRVSPVLAIGGASVDEVIDDQDGTIRRVVGEYAQFIHHVILPDNIRIFRTNLCLWFARSHDILRFILERSVIAVGLAVHVEAHHLTPAGHDVEPVAFNRR